jgi:septal ring factor EnvC (AmiA/AmiB activator)
MAATLAAIALAFAAPPAFAQSAKDAPQHRNDAARQLESSKDVLRQSEQRIEALKGDVKQLETDQSLTNRELVEIARLAQLSESRMSAMEARLGELDAQEKLIRGSLTARHEHIAKLFAAMQRMGRNPPPVIITQREDALKMVRSAMLLARAFPELKSQADDLSRRLTDLVRVTDDIRSEGERLKAETHRLTEARTRLASLMESKRRSLSERQRELQEVRRTAAEIARNVGDLSELIARLDKAVSEQTGLGAYDRELRQLEEQEARSVAGAQPPPSTAPQQQVAGAPPAAVPSGPPATTPMRPSTPDTVPSVGLRPELPPGKETQTAMIDPRPRPPSVLEPQGAFATNPGRMKPAIPFHLAKGQLPLPAQGRRVLAFGEKNQFGRTSQGIVIETRPGGTVVSPCDGWVVYAGEFRSYGQVLIINAGGGYHVLLANLARNDVDVGRFVLAGEPVGAMSTNVAVKSKDAAPLLFVEFRNKDGRSIDPAPWWAGGSQKVQG